MPLGPVGVSSATAQYSTCALHDREELLTARRVGEGELVVPKMVERLMEAEAVSAAECENSRVVESFIVAMLDELIYPREPVVGLLRILINNPFGVTLLESVSYQIGRGSLSPLCPFMDPEAERAHCDCDHDCDKPVSAHVDLPCRR